ncbi:MAG: hypothetical protein ACJAR1_000293 [Rubritalea sp.]|jgi:hypothetical protein|tara:strand:+ start:8034 stop:8219 length:186 start_codon:yes stop_codon:yes gene_type:complete
MKKFSYFSILIISAGFISSCALVNVPVKVVGKIATTTVGVAGKVAGAGIEAVTPNKTGAKD